MKACNPAIWLLWLAVAHVNSAFAENGVTDSEIVIGSSVSASGPLGPLGVGIRDGAAAYFSNVNKQGA